MRNKLVHPGADELHYEIRAIVELAHKLEASGVEVVWENIGDPVAKGAMVPEWIKEIVQKYASKDCAYAYSPTQGVLSTREYIAKERNIESKVGLTADDILFCNGLGDAIATIYGHMNPSARVIGPNPAYPTHSSFEAAHADAPHITYALNPDKGWEPDLEDLEEKLKTYSEIVGIIIINPDNPTGFVYPQDTIRKIVMLARKYNLFLISDEIYSNLAYPNSDMQKLATVIGEVPGIAMRGISKEFPWPGARCGWIEFYNRQKDANFDRYAQSLIDAKMLEVCSTTLPQLVIPEVMSDSRYLPYLDKRIELYKQRSEKAKRTLSAIPELIVHEASGAFYMTPVFRDEVLHAGQSLEISDERRAIINPYLKGSTPDQRFAYELLAATGICIVPLSSGFNSNHQGFRFTLLEQDDEVFDNTLNTLQTNIRTYLDS